MSLERSRYSLNAQIADDQSPTVGSVRGQLQGTMGNILGVNDVLVAEYGRSGGLNDGYVEYSVPIASDDTRVSLRYDKNGVVVIIPELSPVNITSSFSNVGVGVSRADVPYPGNDLHDGPEFGTARTADLSARNAVSNHRCR